MPSARLMSPAWSATKCSANQPGLTGEDLPGNVLYHESVADCLAVDFVTGQLPIHFVKKC